VRKHTEASIFMRLRQTLINDNRILQINTLDDLGELRRSEQDYLVEVRGQIFRSPLNEALETIHRSMDMFGVDVSAGQNQSGQGGGKRNRGQRQQSCSSHDPFGLDANARKGLQLMIRIKDDLAQSKVQNYVLHPTTAGGLNVVITVAQEFLPEGAFDYLLGGDFTVLGKVTRMVGGDDEIGLYQRTLFRNLDSDRVDSLFKNLQDTDFFRFANHPSHIKAPALQIMPLALCA
jgi:hypothetical protein